MRNNRLITICIIMLIYVPLSSQSFQGSNGLFTVANPPKPGRVVTVGGRLSPSLKIKHSTTVSGIVQKVLVNIGQRVLVGQPLISITRNVAGETYLPVVIESRIDGIVSEININENEEVSSGVDAVTILDSSSYLLVTSLSDRDAQAIRRLGQISVLGSTPENSTLNGKIMYVSQEPDYNTGLFSLTMRFPYREEIFLGMVLFVDIEAEKSEGIIVSNSSIYKDGEKNYLWKIGKSNTLILTEVKTGNISNDTVTVISGLLPGDKFLNRLSGKEVDGMDIKELVKGRN